jgi:protein gp37
MAAKTSIEWTNCRCNPIYARNKLTGKRGHHFEHASDGCVAKDGAVGCYAETWNFKRRLGTGLPFTRQSRHLVEMGFDEAALKMPKRPGRVFLCDMTDLFGDFVREAWLDRIFAHVASHPRNIYQTLTKRPERQRDYWSRHAAPANLWAGTSIESRRVLHRLDTLRQTNVALRFLSLEPLLEDLGTLNLDGIDWAIVGAQSGAHARPMDLGWVRHIRDQCIAAGVAFFFKQDATPGGRKSPFPELDGRQWCEFPSW